MSSPKKPTKKELIKAAWGRGELKYKLRHHQRPIYDRIWSIIRGEIEGSSYVLNCARRFGKSFLLILVAIEFCLRFPGSEIRYALPTAKSYMDIAIPSINKILEDAPPVPKIGLGGQQEVDEQGNPVFEPVFTHYKSEKRLHFRNGSLIAFAGTDDGNAKNLRGSASHLNIVDEAAFMDDLIAIYEGILFPQTWDTNGKTIFASTPPEYMDHDYVKIYHEHKEKGLVEQYTIYDNTSLTPERIEEIIAVYGGLDTPRCKREAFCQFVGEEELLITPEWNAAQPPGEAAPGIPLPHPWVQEYPRHPQYFQFWHKYEAMDFGVRDLTVCLFGYYDFEAAKLIIEDEVWGNGQQLTMDVLSKGIKDKEKELWTENPPVYKRIADNNLHLIQELSRVYSLPFVATSKEHLIGDTPDDGMIGKMRTFIKAGRLIVHPRCVQLIGCLQHGKWASKEKIGKLFGRSDVYGHYDATAALCYLIRAVDQHTNPIPQFYQQTNFTHFLPGGISAVPRSHAQEQLAKLFPKLAGR